MCGFCVVSGETVQPSLIPGVMFHSAIREAPFHPVLSFSIHSSFLPLPVAKLLLQ